MPAKLARAVEKASAPANRLVGAGFMHCPLLSEEDQMHALIVMDHTGDSRHHFDPNDGWSLLEAQKRFEELRQAGYTAAKRTGNGTSQLIRQFDPTIKETLFIPRLVGG
jgi:hypothetical protein